MVYDQSDFSAMIENIRKDKYLALVKYSTADILKIHDKSPSIHNLCRYVLFKTLNVWYCVPDYQRYIIFDT